VGQEAMLRLHGRSLPDPVSVRLIVDTGSRRSTLIPGIIRHLEPRPLAPTHVETSVGEVGSELFWVRYDFPGTSLAPFTEYPVARLPMPQKLATFHGVIGRDMLNRWESFHYQGRRARFTLRDEPSWLYSCKGPSE
jgi:hypothetical protein